MSRPFAPFTPFIQRHQVPLFFALAFTLSWLVWGSVIAQQQHLLPFHIPAGLAFYAVSIAACVVAGLALGRAGLWDLARRMLTWRVAPLWYAVAVAVPLALALLPAGIYRVFGGAASIGGALSLGSAALFFLSETVFFLFTEEIAWRGFALPRLQARHSALTASVILGLLWGVWHTPLFFIAGEAQSTLPYPAFVLFAVAESVLMTWVYNHSHGSVLLAALFHAATDAALVFAGVLTGGVGLFWLAALVTCLAAGAVVLVEGPARLARASRERETALVARAAAREDPVRS